MKKTEYITFRTDQSTKESLENIAAEKKWTVSQLAEEIIKTHIGHYIKVKNDSSEIRQVQDRKF